MTSHVSSEDFQLGYSMTGLVERSANKYVNFQTTHLAFVRRSQQQQSEHQDNLNLFHADDVCHQHSTNKNASKHFNSFLTNIELSKMMLSNNTGHHSLDNQMYHSAQRLKRRLTNQRCDSTLSDSSTSTLVEDHSTLKNDDRNGYKDLDREQDLILVLPLGSVSSGAEKDNKPKPITSSNKISTLTNKKCCPVQCIDSMSTVSSVCATPSSSSSCPPCTSQTFSNCFKKYPPQPFAKESTGTKYETTEARNIAKPTKSSKRNFSQFVMPSTSRSKNYSKDFKDSSKEKPVKNDIFNKVQTSSIATSPRVHRLLNKSPFKEWLL